MAYFPLSHCSISYFQRSKAKHFYIIREDDPYIIYATRELAEKQLQKIIDIQHTGNIIIKKDIKTEKNSEGLTSVTITAYQRIDGKEIPSYVIKYSIEKVFLVEEARK